MDQPRFLDRQTQPHIATLILVSSLGPVAMNVFLPALPAIGRHFETEYAVVQLAVPLFLIATAILQIFIGSLSDLLGRRPVLLGSLVLAIGSTILIIHAPSVEVFLAGRVLQATSIAGVVIGRAAIRDTVGPDEAASRMGYVTMAMALGPMIAPVVGGYLAEIYGWQATFWIVVVMALCALALAWGDMGETNRNTGGRLLAQFAAYPTLIGSRRFWGYSLTAALSSSAFYALIGGGPLLAAEFYRLTPSWYGYYFAFVAFGYMVGNFVSGRFARRIGVARMMISGTLLALIAMLASLVLTLVRSDHPVTLFGPMFFVAVGNGIALPSANAGIVSVRPQLAGSASGLGGFIQVGSGAIFATIAGIVIGPGSSAMPLIVVMLASTAPGVFTALYAVWVERRISIGGGK